MLILMLGTVKDLESMVGLAKDMVDTEAMVFNKQHTDSEPIPLWWIRTYLWRLW